MNVMLGWIVTKISSTFLFSNTKISSTYLNHILHIVSINAIDVIVKVDCDSCCGFVVFTAEREIVFVHTNSDFFSIRFDFLLRLWGIVSSWYTISLVLWVHWETVAWYYCIVCILHLLFSDESSEVFYGVVWGTLFMTFDDDDHIICGWVSIGDGVSWLVTLFVGLGLIFDPW